ncbi:MAG: ribbon-helix-helix protein, CopG family [Candidatus Thalassarchaeum sp.]|nr:ribbon-helix-helix protein, CopG family [Candidatus Thalassarchaeum sp.]MDP7356030.1 ribbon-helix-helix protein, CopG family [Candidatus Thalassarchaeaceae archaeon]MEC7364750.1 ribbon-helix-helix protein, CopG family [Candidatus Thermoplasmatota archaeon]GIS03471.1 MAG: hypothetical protein CM15mP105_2280 [Euryarchaeota archaeon]MEC7425482.1 ribbon-helix-helix protein, CopG family [Candidatus Thermoplasmatota archaeon]
MAGNSPMVSLRIPEDHLLELDRLVGFDGMRNRSDVIREAVRRMLATPLPGKGDRIEVDLGPDLTVRLRDYCKIVGESADVVLRQSAREMIRKEMVEGATVVDLLRRRMDELRSRHDEDSNI